jgi:glutathione S-transferase
MHAAGASAALAGDALCSTHTPQRRARAAAGAGGGAGSAASDAVTFYTNRMCPYAQRVAFALHAKGVAHAAVEIDLRNKPAWYTALVPGGKVPALQLPGDAAPRAESLALLRLLDEAFPGSPLFPPPGAARAEVDALFALCDDVWVRRGYAVLSDAAATPAQLAAAFADVAAPVEASLARHAAGGPFLLGGFTAADVAFAPFTERYALAFRELRGWDLLAAHPALASWHAALEAMPAFAASRAPADALLELYRMFLKMDYFNKAGVTTPAPQQELAQGASSGVGRRTTLAALPLAFLPVRGCSVPGSTDTRVPPGVPCTPLWQPAGGAEARAVARLQQPADAAAAGKQGDERPK